MNALTGADIAPMVSSFYFFGWTDARAGSCAPRSRADAFSISFGCQVCCASCAIDPLGNKKAIPENGLNA